jgi:16S rRNA (uracil1498-N3)-methyltransferase
MQQFFTPDIELHDTSYTFDEQESKHIARVLRKVSGEQIRLTNGKGDLFWGTLEVLSQKKCAVSISECEHVAASDVAVHMAVAPTKNMDRFEWFLEKATELGVHRITPILCGRSERKQLKLERCNKIIAAAVKQSLRVYAPTLDPLTALQDLQTEAPISYIAHCEPFEKIALKQAVMHQKECCILIGPEGDFSPEEIMWATKQNITAVHLGDVRLRTETAALSALHTALLLNA